MQSCSSQKAREQERHQSSVGDNGGRLAGGSDAADGGGALSDSSDSGGSVSDSSGLTLGSMVVTRRSVLPKCLNHSDGAAFLGFSFIVHRELFKEEATASH